MARKGEVKRVCLAYSGGLDTSVILRWLIEEYGCEVVAFCADVGQEEELSGLPDKAKATGAVDCVVRDAREEFVRDFVFPALRGGRDVRGPLPARHLARAPGDRQAPGRGGARHGLRRGRARRHRQGQRPGALRADLPRAGARARASSRPGASGTCARARTAWPTPRSTASRSTATLKKPYSMDRNLLHISYEGGILEDPWRAPDESMFLLTVSPEEAPDAPRSSVIGFERGTPVSIDGEQLSPAALLERLNQLAGAHGVGRRRPGREPLRGHASRAACTRRRAARCCTWPTARSSRSRWTAR